MGRWGYEKIGRWEAKKIGRDRQGRKCEVRSVK